MLRFLYRRGMFKGLFGGSKGWTLVWAVIFGTRMLKKLGGSESKTVYSEVVHPGESLLITHEVAPERGRRR